MTPFALISFADTQARRRKTLSQIMPVGDEWSYFVVLSDAYLTTDDGEVQIRSFDDLLDALHGEDALQVLDVARTSGKLTEGRHEIPDAVARLLVRSDAELLSVRRWAYGASGASTRTIAGADLLSVWDSPDLEEIEVVDQSATWYFRMRDDEPLIVLAVRARPLLDRIRQCVAHCLEVGGDFEYAR